jgi:hypothetical protein
MTVEIEVTRTNDAADLARALNGNGFSAKADGDGCVVVEADDLVGVEHALEDWTAERELPFVTRALGDDRIVLCPPGS